MILPTVEDNKEDIEQKYKQIILTISSQQDKVRHHIKSKKSPKNSFWNNSWIFAKSNKKL